MRTVNRQPSYRAGNCWVGCFFLYRVIITGDVSKYYCSCDNSTTAAALHWRLHAKYWTHTDTTCIRKKIRMTKRTSCFDNKIIESIFRTSISCFMWIWNWFNIIFWYVRRFFDFPVISDLLLKSPPKGYPYSAGWSRACFIRRWYSHRTMSHGIK